MEKIKFQKWVRHSVFKTEWCSGMNVRSWKPGAHFGRRGILLVDDEGKTSVLIGTVEVPVDIRWLTWAP